VIRCEHCHAETTNGLTLCDACRIAVLTYLEFLPVYFRNLSRQRRPGRPNGSLGSARQWLLRQGEVDGSKIQPALARASTTLTEWALDVVETLPYRDTEPDTFAAICELLEANISRLATTDQAGRFFRDVARHERILRALTEDVVPGWYAGACRQPAGRDMEGNEHICGATTYVVPGLTWVTCPRCGATTHAAAHLDVILDEARDWIAPPMRLAEAIVVLVDSEHAIDRLHKRISKWGERGHLDAVRRLDDDGDPVGPKRYRLGDILDRLEVEGPTRLVERTYHPKRTTERNAS
jgi:hypothetical protein